MSLAQELLRNGMIFVLHCQALCSYKILLAMYLTFKIFQSKLLAMTNVIVGCFHYFKEHFPCTSYASVEVQPGYTLPFL